MVISEKTLELNICSEISKSFSQKIIWFGLTQRQEAKAGWDACMRLNGRLFILQFKRSRNLREKDNIVYRRFYAPHNQMKNLRERVRKHRSVFYVLPDLHLSRELMVSNNLLDQTFVLDVKDLPTPIPLPLKKDNILRKSRLHYIDAFTNEKKPYAKIHSEPIEVSLSKLNEIKIQGDFIYRFNLFDNERFTDNELKNEANFTLFWDFCKFFKRNCYGGIITK